MHHTTELLKLTLAALSLGRLGKQSFAGNVSERLVKPFFGIKKTNGRKCHSFFFSLMVIRSFSSKNSNGLSFSRCWLCYAVRVDMICNLHHRLLVLSSSLTAL